MPYSSYSRLPLEFNLKMSNGSGTVRAMMYFKKVGMSLYVLKTLFLLHHAWQLRPLSTRPFAIQIIRPLSSFPSKCAMAVRWRQPRLGWYLVKLQYGGCRCGARPGAPVTLWANRELFRLRLEVIHAGYCKVSPAVGQANWFCIRRGLRQSFGEHCQDSSANSYYAGST